MHANLSMYGVADLEEYTASVLSSSTYLTHGLSAVVSDEISLAEAELEAYPDAARHALNRARFLIARLCPLALAKVVEVAG